MRAELDRDKIVAWSLGTGGVEVGDPPDGVKDMARLRFDGTKIVDLAGLGQIHVTCNLDTFDLHCVSVPGSQLVAMAYGQKKQLINDDGVYRIKSNDEITADATGKFNAMLKSNLRQTLAPALGDMPDQLADLSKAIILIMTAISGGDGAAEAQAAIEAIAPAYAGIYPPEVVQAHLEANAAILAMEIPGYYKERQ